ncbi:MULTISPECIES: bifunctional molybdenum cofactor biosynthesis protein MoaC/MoaB [Sphingobacterium]|uniref:Bifunctional molybdenum cofactor biosynthesis protein MoaC/MoaB n=1 Tax=Sphingobacterium litopenaei TaxID=2763500 RepID=A0ABR7YD17_9SPHI|nr:MULTISPECIES: bifunctional molybdenum cofactor biosynthesis protein MoaC/MoaB [Sphingobacterium]MBD1429202.1 bifunctional molybdenum cofactor biosynthesis protein MoaC/MoaB [Sphingobacterium litopenaei]
MRDISHKINTLRTALAQAVIYITESTAVKIQRDELPKGNLFDVARAAAFLGAKATPQLLPHCHPVNIDAMQVDFEYIYPSSHPVFFTDPQLRTGILITVSAKSIGRTGIEMETLTAASIAALELYDMLKPVDNQLEIGHISLANKTGGKSDHNRFLAPLATCAILVCSDATSRGERQDNSGLKIKEMLQETGAQVLDYQIVPDEKSLIQQAVKTWAEQDVHFIFTTGGTGLGPRDVTVEAISELLDKTANGIVEAMRGHGQQRTPLAMMSRAVAGTIGHSLAITLPGSTNGVKECLEAILPALFHARKMMMGGGH